MYVFYTVSVVKNRISIAHNPMLFSHMEIDLITGSLDSVQNLDDLLKGAGKLSAWSPKAFVILIDFLASWNRKQILDICISKLPLVLITYKKSNQILIISYNSIWLFYQITTLNYDMQLYNLVSPPSGIGVHSRIW